MKKLIGMVCVAAVISLFSNTAGLAVTDYTGEEDDGISFSDVTAGTEEAEIIAEAARAGLMSGYEDGSFRPDGNISRAEFAAIVCRLLGLEEDEQSGADTMFDDVPGTHWAAGAISKAAELGIISGYGNGSFGPSDNVLYDQAIKMLVCAEGNGDDAERAGGYPNGYVEVAESMGILDGVSYTGTMPAERADIAKMLINVLNNRENAFVNASDDELSITIE